MPGARDDYLIRLITQAAAAIRRLRGQLDAGDEASDVLREAGTAIGELLGPQRLLLERLDAATAARSLGNPDTVRAWSDLLLLQADAEAALGRTAVAERLRTRATALLHVT